MENIYTRTLTDCMTLWIHAAVDDVFYTETNGLGI